MIKKIEKLEAKIKDKYRLLHRAERMQDKYNDELDVLEERLENYYRIQNSVDTEEGK